MQVKWPLRCSLGCGVAPPPRPASGAIAGRVEASKDMGLEGCGEGEVERSWSVFLGPLGPVVERARPLPAVVRPPGPSPGKMGLQLRVSPADPRSCRLCLWWWEILAVAVSPAGARHGSRRGPAHPHL